MIRNAYVNCVSLTIVNYNKRRVCNNLHNLYYTYVLKSKILSHRQVKAAAI